MAEATILLNYRGGLYSKVEEGEDTSFAQVIHVTARPIISYQGVQYAPISSQESAPLIRPITIQPATAQLPITQPKTAEQKNPTDKKAEKIAIGIFTGCIAMIMLAGISAVLAGLIVTD